MEHFKALKGHADKLSEYTVMAYVLCIGAMIKLMIKKGIEVVVLVLIEMKNSYGPPPYPLLIPPNYSYLGQI